MEKDLVWTIIGVLVGGYVFLFGFLGNLNDWYYSFKLGKNKVPLPPGDLGWPGIGKMLSFIRASKFGDPDSFVFDLVNKYFSFLFTLCFLFSFWDGFLFFYIDLYKHWVIRKLYLNFQL